MNFSIFVEKFRKDGLTFLKSLSKSELIKILNEVDEKYYSDVGGSSDLTDDEYDIIKEITFEKHPELTKTVGSAPTKNKVTLPVEMPSMDKIKPDTDALEKWKKKFFGPTYTISCKVDGVSALYIPREQKLYTRGDGKIGQDVSHLLPYLISKGRLPKLIFKERDTDLIIRGELIMPKETFENKYSKNFANPRNLVSGIVNSIKTIELSKVSDLHFVAYELIEPSLNPSEQFKTLSKLKFEVVRYVNKKVLTNETLSEILLKCRNNYEYEIDGVIVTDDNIHPRKSGKNPEHSFAFKMVLSSQKAEVKVVDVIWEPSKDGYIKPRIQIEPVRLGGVDIEYTTGFNAAFIEKNGIGVGTVIEIVRSGDVIPHITNIIKPAIVTKMPTDIPYVWNETHVDILVENPDENETVKEKNISGFFVGIGVDGLSRKYISRIIKAGFETVGDILKMSIKDFLTVEGFKDKLATKIYTNIQTSVQKANLITIMSASNIFGRGFSEKRITSIIEEYPDILTSSENSEEKITKIIQNVEGMAEKSTLPFVENIPHFLNFLEQTGLSYKLSENLPNEKEEKKDSPLLGKSIVMTGIRDDEIKENAKLYGYNLSNSMSKKTFLLIAKDKNENSSKLNFARENNIPILSVDDFKERYF